MNKRHTSDTERRADSSFPVLKRYECGPFAFSNQDYYDRHLMFDHVVDIPEASARERYEAVARSVRDLLTQRWIRARPDP